MPLACARWRTSTRMNSRAGSASARPWRFAALDTELRASMRTELDALQRRLRVPMVLITHDPEDVRVFGEQVLRMDAGHMMEDIAHA